MKSNNIQGILPEGLNVVLLRVLLWMRCHFQNCLTLGLVNIFHFLHVYWTLFPCTAARFFLLTLPQDFASKISLHSEVYLWREFTTWKNYLKKKTVRKEYDKECISFLLFFSHYAKLTCNICGSLSLLAEISNIEV